MKKQIHFLILTGLIATACHQKDKLVEADMASVVAGTYVLTYSYSSLTNQDSVFFPGSLVLTRVNSTTVKPTFQLAGIDNNLIEKSTWNLTEVTKDSISYRGSGYVGGIKGGQISMFGYADATYYFRFAKK